jgi:hypothetical protein
MWVGTSSAKAEVATGDEVAVREAEIRVDQDGVQVSLHVPALETEQACTMRWDVASVEEICGRALVKRVQKGGTRNPDLPGDIFRPHWGERRVRRQSKGLSRVQGRIAMGEGAPQRRTEGGIGRSLGAVGA